MSLCALSANGKKSCSGKESGPSPKTMGEQDLACTIQHMPSLVMICSVVFVLECWHRHTHTRKYTIHADHYVSVSNNKPIQQDTHKKNVSYA